MNFDVHFCLVSKQALANLLPVLDGSFRPKRAVLFVTADMKNAAKNLADVFKRYQVSVSMCDIADPYDIKAIRDVVFEQAFQLRDNNIVLNMTGGTKTMAIGAQEAFASAGFPYFYLNHENDELQIIHTEKVANSNQMEVDRQVLSTKLTLETCLNAQGFAVESKDELNVNDVQRDLMDFLVSFSATNSASVKALNYITSKLEREKSLSCNWLNSLGKSPDGGALFKEILDKFEKAGYLTYTRDTLTFTSADARAFANGLWFEHYVASKIPDAKVTDKTLNLVVRSGGVKNELDVAVIARNRLHIIECKTRNMQGESDEHIREAIYKLEMLKRLGGSNSRCALVSYLPITNKHFRERAADSEIKLVDGTQIKNLPQILNEWLS